MLSNPYRLGKYLKISLRNYLGSKELKSTSVIKKDRELRMNKNMRLPVIEIKLMLLILKITHFSSQSFQFYQLLLMLLELIIEKVMIMNFD